MLKSIPLKQMINGSNDEFFKFLSNLVCLDTPETGKEIIPGIYIAGLNAGNFIKYMVIDEYDSFSDGNDCRDNYGVCDNHEQILKEYPELQECTDRNFVVLMTPIVKAEEPEKEGWRWHKWGDYIGDYEPQCEYIHDEPLIEKVYVYHIYEVR